MIVGMTGTFIYILFTGTVLEKFHTHIIIILIYFHFYARYHTARPTDSLFQLYFSFFFLVNIRKNGFQVEHLKACHI